MVTTEWAGADFGSLLRSHIAPFVGKDQSRVALSGPKVVLGPEMVTNIGMVIHELATNAAKYGAWSNDDGIVRVTWALSRAGRDEILAVEWSETGGPPLSSSSHMGFGSKLIDASVRVIERRVATEGLLLKFSLVVHTDAEARPQPARNGERRPQEAGT